MNKIKTALLASLLVMALIVTQQAQAQTTQLKIYTDPEGFYTLQYPANWTTKYQPSISKLEEAITYSYVDGKPSISMSINKVPAPSEQQGFRDSFSQTVELLKKRYGHKIIAAQFGLYKIDGQDAGGMLEQLQTTQDKTLIISSVFNGKLMFIRFTASENDYNSHIAEVEKVIDSIKITGPNRE